MELSRSKTGVVVPTLGTRDAYLRAALLSLSSQIPVPPLVVVVAPSTQVYALRAAHPRVNVVACDTPGIAPAIEAGWRTFPSEIAYIGWLGDDDTLPTISISQSEAVFSASPKVVMTFGRTRYIDSDGTTLREVRAGRMAVTLMKLAHYMIGQPGALYRRSAVTQIGPLDHSLALAFDCDLHLRLTGVGTVAYIPAVLGEVRWHPGSLTVALNERSRAEGYTALARNWSGWKRRTHPLWRGPALLFFRAWAKLSTRIVKPWPVGSTESTTEWPESLG